ncbi:glycoside hydrolase family 9 protein [Teredinibacter purpureus]|uniref:glycoside hydrolase family 9 protein n=1 Tax=Teredinibacter purpureus TaxID=2731756 RepID=UPI0005F7E386|nr:glycoside hydrolase family 9 protein [Teredinibacter purpureus]
MKRFVKTLILVAVTSVSNIGYAAPLALNEQEYFEKRGLNVFVFNNWYNGLFSDSKMSGLEIVHHGVRTSTNGDVRLNSTPEQWDKIPAFIERKVDLKNQTVEAFLHYPEFDFKYSVRAAAVNGGLKISVSLPKALPKALEGVAGFNLEFIPSVYFEKSFLMDEHAGTFPLYPSGPKEVNGVRAAQALASGQTLVLAPEDMQRRVMIKSNGPTLQLYDGRNKAQNGWFVVRSLIPSGKKGDVIEWHLSASTDKHWLREPSIGHSQVGYHPNQKKIAVIELDKYDTQKSTARLIKILADGSRKTIVKAKPSEWGNYQRYHYRTFDFSAVQDSGLYVLEYGAVTTAPFRIGGDVYSTAWHPTMDVFMPVQMDHLLINEAYRVWHGASHLDDALQAPVNHKHFDLFAQGPTTDSPYKPGEHIPGLNIGGWYDAGDYDIRTQSQYRAISTLVDVWETFRPERDTTSVDYPRKFVDLHVPDGKPDVLQQIEHGALALIAQYRAVGHAIPGIIVPTIDQYTHLGDGLTMTDNLIYNAGLDELESNGYESGKFDDRWAFTSYSSKLNYGGIAGLASASRALKGYNEALAKECLATAIREWQEEQSHEPVHFHHGNTTGSDIEIEHFKAALALLKATGEPQYRQAVGELLAGLAPHFNGVADLALKAIPYMDAAYKARVRALTEAYVKALPEQLKKNPYGVTIGEGGWAGNGWVLLRGINHYYMHKAFPDLIDKEMVYQSLNYLYGNHPDSDISLVSAVGTRSKKVAYGMNRADYSFIAGGVVPGILMLKPDLPENREDWPFLWGENEYVIPMGPWYVFLVQAVEDLVKETK